MGLFTPGAHFVELGKWIKSPNVHYKLKYHYYCWPQLWEPNQECSDVHYNISRLTTKLRYDTSRIVLKPWIRQLFGKRRKESKPKCNIIQIWNGRSRTRVDNMSRYTLPAHPNMRLNASLQCYLFNVYMNKSRKKLATFQTFHRRVLISSPWTGCAYFFPLCTKPNRCESWAGLVK